MESSVSGPLLNVDVVKVMQVMSLPRDSSVTIGNAQVTSTGGQVLSTLAARN